MMLAFSFNHVKYILYHYFDLSRGKFTDSATAERLGMPLPRQPRAIFEAACLLAAEVALRVKKCGMDGLITEAVFMGEQGLRTESDIAREYHIDECEVHRRIRRVVAYCEGFDTREQDYETWRKENRFRKGVR